MRIKKLAIVILTITILGIALFSIMYYLKQDPKSYLGQKAPFDLSRPPKFLYAISNEPAHPLDRPMSVIVVKDRIFVSDVGRKEVLVFDYNGNFLRNLKISSNVKFQSPYGMAFDGENLYIADSGQGCIYIFDAGGNYRRILQTKGVQLGSPAGLFFQSGKLYVSDLSKHQVFALDTAGNLLQTFGKEGKSPGELYFPHGIVADSSGKVYVSDSGNNRIEVFSDGLQAVVNRGQVETPRGMGVDSIGNLWVVAGLGNAINVYTFDGTRVLSFGTAGRDYGKLYLPNGIYIDHNNRIYVTELGNNRVSVFSYEN